MWWLCLMRRLPGVAATLALFWWQRRTQNATLSLLPKTLLRIESLQPALRPAIRTDCLPRVGRRLARRDAHGRFVAAKFVDLAVRR